MIKRYSRALLALLFLVFGFFSTTQAADNYPDRKVVSLIVPYPAGGASDASARIFNGPIGESLGQTVIVENIGGATGAIRSEEHTSELQSRGHIVCRLLLEKKKHM